MPLTSRSGLVVVGITAGCTAIAVSLTYRWWRKRKRRSVHFSRSSAVYLTRHGESTVNARSREYRQQGDAWPARAYHEAEFMDAPLTDRGRDEASNDLQQRLKENMRSKTQEDNRALTSSRTLVVTSTLRRAMQTAELGVLPLFPPGPHTTWIALDSVRESTTSEVHADGPVEVSESKPCNMRMPLSHARELSPHTDFTSCKDEDPLPQIETTAMVDQRVFEFAQWVHEWVTQQAQEAMLGGVRELEINVVVVSHYVFLHRLLSKLDEVSGGASGSHGLKNCEIRVLPLFDFLKLG